jgi:hypothetical protein
MTDQEALDYLEQFADADVDLYVPPGDVLIELGTRLEKYEAVIDRAEEAMKIAKRIRDGIAQQQIPDTMRNRGLIKNNGTGNYALPSGNKVSLRNSTKPGVRVADMPEAYIWFQSEGFLDVVYQSPGAKFKVSDEALLAAVKALRKAGRALPAWLGTFEIVKATILNPRKAKETTADE